MNQNTVYSVITSDKFCPDPDPNIALQKINVVDTTIFCYGIFTKKSTGNPTSMGGNNYLFKKSR
jgi:hypothetical protein